MAGAVSWVPAETWNVVEFRLRSRQLAQLMRNDFSSIKAELAKAFPKTASIQERYVPFVWRYAHELSGMYSMAVLRNFVNRASANTDPFIKLKDVYQRSDVDRFLHNVHRKLLVQNTIIVTARPIPGVPNKVRLYAFEPWQVDVTPDDAMDAGDLTAAKMVRLQVPIDASYDALATVVYGTLVMTPQEIYIDGPGGKKPFIGNSTVNPFGRIPVIVLRGEDPLPGRWCAPLNEAVLKMAIALCLTESDTELLVHMQAWGQKVIKNAQPGQLVDEMQVGPDKVLALVNMDMSGGAGPELAIVQGQPPIAQMTNYQESRLRQMCSMLDLAPDAFMKVNTSVTGDARDADSDERDDAKQRYAGIFLAAEQELVELIGDCLNLQGAVKIPKGTTVELQYTDPDFGSGKDAQGEVELGLTCPQEILATRKGMTLKAATDKVQANLDATRKAGVVFSGKVAADPGTAPGAPPAKPVPPVPPVQP